MLQLRPHIGYFALLQLLWNRSMKKHNNKSLAQSKSRYCDYELYDQLAEEFAQTGKKPKKMVEILFELSTETDYYQMNEFEMSLLTGEKLDALRNNRRVNKTKNKRWYFIKGEGDQSNNSKITYPLGLVRQKLEMSKH